MEKYTGYLNRIFYYDEQSHYIACLIETDQLEDTITMNGYMSGFNEYQKYAFYGEFVVHPKYGKQFKMDHYENIVADDDEEVIKYLSSPLFRGIGPSMATNIVKTIGDDCLNRIKENPDLLDNVKNMTVVKKNSIVTTLKNNNSDSKLMEFVMGHGISLKNISMIEDYYKEKTFDILTRDPYKIVEDIDGIGFKTVDEIALKSGIDADDKERLKAGIVYCIKELCYQTGSTYVIKEKIENSFVKMIPTASNFNEYLDELINDHIVINKEDRYYYYQYYDSEITITNFIKRINKQTDDPIAKEEIDKAIKDFGKNNAIEYASNQIKAIKQFMNNDFMLLTGGPGTGKTTIVNAMIHIFAKLYPDKSIALVAPTGRASKRLTELTGVKASTIHSLLQWDLHSNHFARNSKNPIEEKVIIIDEFSMVDSLLLAKLFEASRDVYKVLFIGDYHQLPSVSPGNVLHELMEADVLKVELTEIFRQEEQSGIIKLAHDIVSNDFTSFDIFNDYNDINFFDCNNISVVKNICTIVKKALDEDYDINDIQVLAPKYKGVAGIDNINSALQSLINPTDDNERIYRYGQKEFHIGDKILQLKNRPDDNVFNGDIGTLIEIHRKDNFDYLEDVLVCDFDGDEVLYSSKDLNTISLAYCMSIHKSQGNEFKIVIMSVLKDYGIMLRRNLLYTGITRAKQSLFIIGSKEAFDYGIKNDKDNNRKSTLLEAFNKKLSIEDYY
ncbi:MAG: ATP-dependent RecD-like DNA helicase [Thomasclavelia sp.]|nr:ATP-dependent RecD-like DNA helicase [Thomasclavelia sp.]